MRSGAKVGIVGGVFVLVAGGLGYGAYAMVGGGSDGDTGTGSLSAQSKSGPPSKSEIDLPAEHRLCDM